MNRIPKRIVVAIVTFAIGLCSVAGSFYYRESQDKDVNRFDAADHEILPVEPPRDDDVYLVLSAVIEQSITDEVPKLPLSISDSAYLNRTVPLTLERRFSTRREYLLVDERKLRSD